mgnify:CR=1 FL=1
MYLQKFGECLKDHALGLSLNFWLLEAFINDFENVVSLLNNFVWVLEPYVRQSLQHDVQNHGINILVFDYEFQDSRQLGFNIKAQSLLYLGQVLTLRHNMARNQNRSGNGEDVLEVSLLHQALQEYQAFAKRTHDQLQIRSRSGDGVHQFDGLLHVDQRALIHWFQTEFKDGLGVHGGEPVQIWSIRVSSCIYLAHELGDQDAWRTAGELLVNFSDWLDVIPGAARIQFCY